MTIYENDRIAVTNNLTNGSRVTISDKFAGVAPFSMHKEAFEMMCVEVAKQIDDREKAKSN